MTARLWVGVAIATMWACGGATFSGGTGADGGSGGSGSGGSGSGSGGSSSGGGGSGSSSGGAGSSSGGAGGSSSGGAGSSSSGGGTSPCPSSAPAAGASCPSVALECEFGSDPNPECNVIARCTASGWSSTPPGGTCGTGTCPASYADVPKSTVCKPAGLDCAYAEGQCNCSQSGPVAMLNPEWICASPGNGCPEPRPRVGASCTAAGLSCDYGACSGGVAVECKDGVWVEENVPCPL